MTDLLRLGDIAKATAGKNTSRLNKEDASNILTIQDLEDVLVDVHTLDIKNQVVISLVSKRCAPYLKSDKVITANFVVLEFDKEKLNTWYLTYLINEDRSVKQQLNVTDGLIANTRVRVIDIENLEIPIIPMESQRYVGEMYHEMLVYEQLLKTKAETTKKGIFKIIGELTNGRN